jgi:hypothetical protein
MLLTLALYALVQAPQTTSALITAESSHDTPAIKQTLITLTDTLPTADHPTLAASIPPILRAAADPDPKIRSLAMLTLAAIAAPAATLLDPHIPAIAQHLNDPDPAVRQLTATVLGALPHALLPLLAALTAPHRPTDADLGILLAILSRNIAEHPEAIPAITGFLNQPRITPTLLTRSLNAIANSANHSPTLDTALQPILNPPHSPAIRTTLALTLPKLKITQQDLDRTRARLTRIAASSTEPKTLRDAAKSILPCWHAPAQVYDRTNACPALPIRYQMRPAPAPIAAPRYQTPPLH